MFVGVVFPFGVDITLRKPTQMLRSVDFDYKAWAITLSDEDFKRQFSLVFVAVGTIKYDYA